LPTAIAEATDARCLRAVARPRWCGQCEDVLGRPIKERRFELEAALRLRDGVHLAVRPDDDTS